MKKELQRRLKNFFVALDVFLFCLICLGNTKRNETASSAAWSLKLDNKLQGHLFVYLIDSVALVIGDINHCEESYNNERPNNDKT